MYSLIQRMDVGLFTATDDETALGVGLTLPPNCLIMYFQPTVFVFFDSSVSKPANSGETWNGLKGLFLSSLRRSSFIKHNSSRLVLERMSAPILMVLRWWRETELETSCIDGYQRAEQLQVHYLICQFILL